MKVTKAQAQANRAHIVETASALFRERGYDGVGVADLMAAAGFTHGGFYKHFGSKADLMAEAAACGLASSTARSEGVDLAQYLDRYLSREHRDNPAAGCTLAALSSDAARQPDAVKAVFAEGLEQLLETLQAADGPADAVDEQAQRARRLSVIATLVGAITLSRACPDDSALADEILEACRDRLLPPQ
ncbi:TetR/AcrR family transcriptional regulator [Pseudomonas sp. UFMG81]|uniref:TetR/AcrR family transcriptional regulator n=1 Tax=Pseudomonas sp. UFMG81 TaxID=2745936 RepID=UPI00188FB5C4|nr:TetR family transcriptional regulator [Pseudomonas sp. UFMG81]